MFEGLTTNVVHMVVTAQNQVHTVGGVPIQARDSAQRCGQVDVVGHATVCERDDEIDLVFVSEQLREA